MITQLQKRSRIAISWSRLPPYAARLIRAGIQNLGEPVEIIASRPVALINEVESIIGQPINWVDSNQTISWSDLEMDIPEIFFQAGWLSKAFKNLGKEVDRNGGQVVCFSDNSWKNTPRQWLGALAFRIRYLQYFDAMWVPGHSGMGLLEFYGMPKHKIYQGMYGADPEVFFSQASLENREKKFVFVGQLIERKGINLLITAFSKFHLQHPEWKLHVIGQGALMDRLLNVPGIEVEGFKPPSYVADVLRESRFLILPSYEEHWGLVVHEAALCGCGLIVSDAVGASWDLIGDRNGIVFKSNSSNSLYQGLVRAASFSETELELISSQSKAKASKFGPEKWSKTFAQIITDARTKNQVESEKAIKIC
ncbi:MAG: hypothetical protein Kow0049_01980 [Stanieria sp.]